MRLSVADDSGAICFAVDCEVSHSVAHLVQFLIAPTLGSAWPLDSIELRSKWATDAPAVWPRHDVEAEVGSLGLDDGEWLRLTRCASCATEEEDVRPSPISTASALPAPLLERAYVSSRSPARSGGRTPRRPYVDDAARSLSPLEENPPALPGRAESLPRSPYRKRWKSEEARALDRGGSVATGDSGGHTASAAMPSLSVHHAARVGRQVSDAHTITAPGSLGSDFWRSRLGAFAGSASSSDGVSREFASSTKAHDDADAAMKSYTLMERLRSRRRPFTPVRDGGAAQEEAKDEEEKERRMDDTFTEGDRERSFERFAAGSNDDDGGEQTVGFMAQSLSEVRLRAALESSSRLSATSRYGGGGAGAAASTTGRRLDARTVNLLADHRVKIAALEASQARAERECEAAVDECAALNETVAATAQRVASALASEREMEDELKATRKELAHARSQKSILAERLSRAEATISAATSADGPADSSAAHGDDERTTTPATGRSRRASLSTPFGEVKTASGAAVAALMATDLGRIHRETDGASSTHKERLRRRERELAQMATRCRMLEDHVTALEAQVAMRNSDTIAAELDGALDVRVGRAAMSAAASSSGAASRAVESDRVAHAAALAEAESSSPGPSVAAEAESPSSSAPAAVARLRELSTQRDAALGRCAALEQRALDAAAAEAEAAARGEIVVRTAGEAAAEAVARLEAAEVRWSGELDAERALTAAAVLHSDEITSAAAAAAARTAIDAATEVQRAAAANAILRHDLEAAQEREVAFDEQEKERAAARVEEIEAARASAVAATNAAHAELTASLQQQLTVAALNVETASRERDDAVRTLSDDVATLKNDAERATARALAADAALATSAAAASELNTRLASAEEAVAEARLKAHLDAAQERRARTEVDGAKSASHDEVRAPMLLSSSMSPPASLLLTPSHCERTHILVQAHAAVVEALRSKAIFLQGEAAAAAEDAAVARTSKREATAAASAAEESALARVATYEKEALAESAAAAAASAALVTVERELSEANARSAAEAALAASARRATTSSATLGAADDAIAEAEAAERAADVQALRDECARLTEEVDAAAVAAASVSAAAAEKAAAVARELSAAQDEVERCTAELEIARSRVVRVEEDAAMRLGEATSTAAAAAKTTGENLTALQDKLNLKATAGAEALLMRSELLDARAESTALAKAMERTKGACEHPRSSSFYANTHTYSCTF